ncbi:poly(ADP-ribose) glycohydrolase, putative [Entamoeba histolytica HM-1:IMSS-B]|uniref:poly(ADP-ribose) glycohydrolase n=6 Tax=Entamoeba histolytica TaxID=5759 RepID=C4LY84_ENTH1|nr:poly(ADP-ribose) glycohydrolase, putative [Entamoeba histolytica HM-1:IMSS]EMD48884.1 poly(ADPribose) glycohydrolase, putative [Entamoeba histolytica KU27]EMH76777.1 poly(ADP-ribose) glycohydrolase, putative [Entamoeba histolytica HM-1:IMSS-B]EMS16368.1 poly(ADP-ribose) glycohydrolase [Entamoeba histolytica HM-3:IMSS]ENY63388.1 poly(ADP-ribose) glycohydrolase, putative [Entamoeba histolytica HM-1:IMSS-A]GAT93763.1 poly dp-ribose glycohydrolase putative [Entamoeba histolytica]|eukprot:XP_653399.1 poly(ADP-ribose) glycohydrolase, putative [Entamoeba histolytica HM-1:IMSS]
MENKIIQTSTLSIEKIRTAITKEFKTCQDVVEFFINQEEERTNKKINKGVGDGYEIALKSFYNKVHSLGVTKKSFEEYFQWFIGGLKNAMNKLINNNDGNLEKNQSTIYIPISKSGTPSTIQIKRWEIFGILACSFFNVQWDKKVERIGNLSFVYISTNSRISIQRLICIFAYFHVMIEMDEKTLQEIVTYERVIQKKPYDWEHNETPIKTYPFVSGGLEMSEMNVHVDFANKYLQIHKIVPSITQEELLFSVRPECLISLILFEVLLDNEAVLIKNTLHISLSEGYQQTFKWIGFCKNQILKQPNIILAIDSVINSCFGKENIDRDLNKCMIGFQCAGNKIATGQWGCGSFGNDQLLKMAQQYMVLSTLGLEASIHWMNFSRYNELNDYMEICKSKKMTVKDIYYILCSFDGDKNTFVDYFKQQVQSFHK